MRVVQKMKNETTSEAVAKIVIAKYGKTLEGKDLENKCSDVYGDTCDIKWFSELDYDNISDTIGFYQDIVTAELENKSENK